MVQFGKELVVWQKGGIFCTFSWKNIQDDMCFLTVVPSDSSQAGWILDLPCVFEPNPIFFKMLAEMGNKYSVENLLSSVTTLNFL